MSTEFAGRVALVTGAGSGIGRAVARRLSHVGASVVLVGRGIAKLRSVEREMAPGSALPLALDLTHPNADDVLVEAVQAQHGRLDILVHSAGLFDQGSIHDTSANSMRDLLETNAVAPYATTRALLPMLVEARGQIVFINSSVVGARRGGIAAYAASKAALSAFADTLREEVNSCGVRVLNLFVGRTATPMQERIFATEGRAYQPADLLQPEDVAAAVMSALTLPDTAEITDLHIRPMRKSAPREFAGRANVS